MVKSLSDSQFRSLQKRIGASQQGSNRLYAQINKTIGTLLEYYTDTGTFDLDILELPLNDDNKRLATYSHGYPPCLVPTVVRLLRQYVEEHGGDFDHVKEYETRTKHGFSDYFQDTTSIPYADLVDYEPR